MTDKRKVLALGFQAKKEAFEDYELHFESPDKCPHLNEYDFIIIPCGLFVEEYEEGALRGVLRLSPPPPGAIRREQETKIALENGKMVCFIGHHVRDYLVKGILKSFSINLLEIENELIRNLEPKRSQFFDFIKNFGATYVLFRKEDIDDVLCTYGNNVAGFSKRIGKGTLVFLPWFAGSKEPEYILDSLRSLSKCLISYSTRIRYEAPSWIKPPLFLCEKNVGKEIEVLKQEIAKRQPQLQRYDRLKSVLWLGNDDLVKAVKFFLEEIGFETREDSDYEEDLWLLAQGTEQVIIEIKGKNKNVTRPDISKLDEHRGAKGKPEDFPALLIVNSFMIANSMEEKDIPPSPPEVEKAKRTNVVIMRTLDLCNIYRLIEGGKLIPEELLTKLKIEKGWIKVEDGSIRVV